jgi:hypothetical protein
MQNTTNWRSSRRKEYVNGATDRLFANSRTTSLFLGPNTFSAGNATWCGQHNQQG